jgi:hypothetical protein
MFLHFVPVDGVEGTFQEFFGRKGMFLCFYVSIKRACGQGLLRAILQATFPSPENGLFGL